MLRSFDDPLRVLRSNLLTEGAVWSKPPKSDAAEPVIDLLRRACSYLEESSRRLVLIFDQFEEALILHQGEPQSLRPICDFLDAVVRIGLPRLTVLVTLRTEYEGMLAGLRLAPFEQGGNWMKVNPFSERDAREFLKNGFKRMGDDLLDAMMAEAAAIEGTRGLVRPITLNMLGAVLARSADNKELRAARGRVLTAELERLLDAPDIRDQAREILAPMLTDAGTKRPRSIGELERATGVQAGALEGCLLHLASHGLVRRVNRTSDLRERIWEVSHDFVARLIENVLRRPRRRLWALTRSVGLAAAFLIWLAVFAYLLPDYLARAQQRIVSRLSSDFGLSVRWDDAVAGYRVVAADKEFSRLSEAGPLLCRLGKIESLDLSNCKTLPSVEGLRGISGLKTLDLSFCQSLISLDGVQGAATLEKLRLQSCTGLTTLDALNGLSGLRELDLLDCSGLTSVDALHATARLETLFLAGVQSVENLEGLQALTRLKMLWIGGSNLTSLKGMKRLRNLETLLIMGCDRLTALEGLQGLPNVETVTVVSCPRVASLGTFEGLSKLRNLTLGGCRYLTRLDSLKELGGLRGLDLSDCSALTTVEALQKMPRLQTLLLVNCQRLGTLNGIQVLTSIREVDLGGCTALTSVDELQHVKSLRVLRLKGCEGLNSVSKLGGLADLKMLDLRGCRRLATLDGLQGLKSLTDLDLRWMATPGLDSLLALQSLKQLGLSPEMVTPQHLMLVKEKLPRVTLVTGWYEPAFCGGDLPLVQVVGGAIQMRMGHLLPAE